MQDYREWEIYEWVIKYKNLNKRFLNWQILVSLIIVGIMVRVETELLTCHFTPQLITSSNLYLPNLNDCWVSNSIMPSWNWDYIHITFVSNNINVNIVIVVIGCNNQLQLFAYFLEQQKVKNALVQVGLIISIITIIILPTSYIWRTYHELDIQISRQIF